MAPEIQVSDCILTIILGGLLGIIGQGLRVVVGLKKLNKTASDENKPFKDLFNGTELVISLLIGFIAGSLAILGMTWGDAVVKPSKELFTTILGAGYAGTDFIEGFINKYLHK